MHHPPMPCLLLLAAGRSRRLGRPKGTLGGSAHPLLLRQLQLARAAGFTEACVVLGAAAPRLRTVLSATAQRALGFRRLTLIHAHAWREGMGGSLRDGLRALPADWHAALVLLVDQAWLEAEDLRALVKAARGGGRWQLAAACTRSGGRRQAPVVLPRGLTPTALARLRGDTGLGPWLNGNTTAPAAGRPAARDVQAVLLPRAGLDLDTPTDAARWRTAQRKRGPKPPFPLKRSTRI